MLISSNVNSKANGIGWNFFIEDSCFKESGVLNLNPIPQGLSWRAMRSIAVVKTYSNRRLNVPINVARLYLMNRWGSDIQSFKNSELKEDYRQLAIADLAADLRVITQGCMPSLNFYRQYYQSTLRYIENF